MTKKDKWILILEIIGVLIALIVVVATKYWPEFKNSFGSSEKLYSYANYKTGIEINIDSGPLFFLNINEDNILTNIFIENIKAGPIANQNIEGSNIVEGIEKIINILTKNNEISNKTITIINYQEEEVFNQVVEKVKTLLPTNNIITETSTLEKKGTSLNLDNVSEENVLMSLYLQSTELIEDYELEQKESTTITEKMAGTYTDNIYQKLLTYQQNKNIKDQDINDISMPIQYIPGDENNSVFPTTDSWYYIENYQVYAEISIEQDNTKYTYCYQGSISSKKEGTCR